MILVGLFLLVISPLALAVVTATVNSPNGNQYIKGTYTIDFNWTDTNTAASPYRADLYYSSTQGAFSNLIALNVSLTDANGTNPDSNVATSNNYVWQWITTSATDGNYFIDVLVHDGNTAQGSDSSNTSFNVDNTNPSTTWSGNSSTWLTSNTNITLTCTDANSGCSSTQYRLDTNGTTAVSVGAWTTYSSSISFTTDGNYGIDFNSTDRAGNIESTNRGYVLMDKTSPTTTDNLPIGWQTASFSVALTCSDGDVSVQRSGCSTTQYRIANGTWTTYSSAITVNTDGNRAFDYNSSDVAGNRETTNNKYLLLDTVNPSTTWDGNHNTWQANDANIALTCSDATSGCSLTQYRLDTTASATINYGSWQTYSTKILVNYDGNYAIDFNSTDTATNRESTQTYYVLVDKTLPTVTITNTSTSVSSSPFVMTYTGSDSNGSITKYWVSSDGNTYIDNGLNTSYTFGFDTSTSSTRTYFVKATDASDRNSTAVSISISFSIPTSGSNQQFVCGDASCDGSENGLTCPADCGTSKVVKETVFTQTFKQATPEDIISLLENAGIASDTISQTLDLQKELTIDRTITGTKLIEGSTTQYQTHVRIRLTNNSSAPLNEAFLIEEVPKNIVENASLIHSSKSFTILKNDPIIQFSLGNISLGETVEIQYYAPLLISESQATEFSKGVLIAEFEPETATDLCANTYCEDNNPCTTNTCVNGLCKYTTTPNGTTCGSNKQCLNGICQETTITNTIPRPPLTETTSEPFNGLLMVGAGLLIIIAVTALLRWKKTKN